MRSQAGPWLRSRLPLLLLLACTVARADPLTCRDVRFGVVGFSDVTAVSTVAGEMLQQLGYNPSQVNLSVPIIFASLQNRNIDVFLGNWMPAQQGDRQPYFDNHSVEQVTVNLKDARFTLAVPHYLYEAGLKDFADIARFGAQLNHSIYGIEPGAAANRLVLSLISANAFGLGSFKLVESSEQGMLAELERADRDHRPIVFVGWAPHPMNVRFRIDYLSGGDASFGPDFGGATINTVVRAGFVQACPNVGHLLQNLTFTLQSESDIMAAVLDGHRQPQQAARDWLGNHPEAVGEWLAGVRNLDGSPAHVSFARRTPAAAGGSLESWLIARKIPVGDTAAAALEAVKSHSHSLFDAVSATLRTAVGAVNTVLGLISPLAFISLAVLLTGWLKRSWPLALFMLLALMFILNQGYWQAMLETLSLVLVATTASVLLGVPMGIAAAHHPALYAAVRPVLDMMQTLPTFVYLIPALVLFGLGPVPGLLATVIFAMPAPIRLTQAGIAAVPRALREAAESFGATRTQLLLKVELPSAAPMILAGVTQCVMLSLSMVVIAGLVGAGGLGVPVVRALNSVQVGEGFDAGFAIVLLAIALDRLSRPRQRP